MSRSCRRAARLACLTSSCGLGPRSARNRSLAPCWLRRLRKRSWFFRSVFNNRPQIQDKQGQARAAGRVVVLCQGDVLKPRGRAYNFDPSATYSPPTLLSLPIRDHNEGVLSEGSVL